MAHQSRSRSRFPIRVSAPGAAQRVEERGFLPPCQPRRSLAAPSTQQVTNANPVNQESTTDIVSALQAVLSPLKSPIALVPASLALAFKLAVLIIAFTIQLYFMGIYLVDIVKESSVLRQIGDQRQAIIIRDGQPTLVDRERTSMGIGMSGMFLCFVASLPLLGAYVSHAKGRGFVEGYALSTFFCCFGLVVVLCLPNIRRRRST